ncbi:N-acetylglucosamine-6-phosphate deacetylase [Halotydeus destructor]|nr:N-acetylglucosamine-6-phosphate deacetylase [Halotydeus destructor]
MSVTKPVTQFVNCRLVRNHSIIREDLWVRNGQIIDPEKLYFDERRSADQVVDCNNLLISPGFIDLQFNGGFGYDFSDPTIYSNDDAVQLVSRKLLAHGVTAYCPTLITGPPETYKKIVPHLRKRPGNKIEGAAILGIHLEGPFISKEKKGAHPSEYIKEDKLTSVNQINQTYGDCLDNVAIITLAPELDTDGTVTKQLAEKGIVVSLGHSESNLTQAELHVNSGATFITHLFNAMLPFHHRDPGLVGLIASSTINKKVYFGIIADNVHTHYTALKIAYKTNPSSLVLVTDAMSATGLEEGKVHKIGSQSVEIKDHKAHVAGTNTLAGSIATMDQCVRNVIQATSCSLVEAIEFASLHPAQVLGVSSSKGTLDFGSDADFIFLDEGLTVIATYITGEKVYES